MSSPPPHPDGSIVQDATPSDAPVVEAAAPTSTATPPHSDAGDLGVGQPHGDGERETSGDDAALDVDVPISDGVDSTPGEEDVIIESLDGEEVDMTAEASPAGVSDLEEQLASGEAFTFEDDSIQGFFAHQDAVYCLGVSLANPNLACSGGGDDCAFLWDISTGERMHTLEGHTDSVVDVAFNVDGSLVATAAMDATVKIWNSDSGELVSTLEGPGDAVEWVAWHEKADVVLAGDSEGSTWMWRGPKWTLLNYFGGHSGRVTCGLFTPDGKKIITASEDASLRVWDPKSAETLVHIKEHPFHREAINCMAHHPHKPVVLTGGVDCEAILSNTQSGKVVGKFLGHEDSVEDLAFSPGYDWACTASLDATLRVWDVHTTSERALLRGHAEGVSKVIWHPKEPHLIYSGSLDRTVSLWDGRVGEAVRSWKGPTDMILAMALSQLRSTPRMNFYFL